MSIPRFAVFSGRITAKVLPRGNHNRLRCPIFRNAVLALTECILTDNMAGKGVKQLGKD